MVKKNKQVVKPHLSLAVLKFMKTSMKYLKTAMKYMKTALKK